MLFKIAPDSAMVSKCWRNGIGRYAPLLSLLWLMWLFGPLFFGLGHDFGKWLWPTLASLPVFLVLYAFAYAGPRKNVAWFAVAITALGGVLTPFNPYAETYLIYACAVAAFCSTPRRSFQVMAFVLVLYSVEWLALQFPVMYLVNAFIIGLIVGIMTLYQRSERDREAELRLSHDEVRRLAATAERERIGRDLHDLLGHTLSLVAVKSELARRLLERDPVAARREIAEVERVAREALSQVRSAVTGIRAAGLAAELASARLLLESAGVVFEYANCDGMLPEGIECTLAMVLREAVTNIQRHARATRAEVSVEHERDRAILRVHDNGRGGIGVHGNGLTGMRERIETMGGKLEIRSEHGRGTELTITLPLPTTEAASLPKPARGVAPATAISFLKHA